MTTSYPSPHVPRHTRQHGDFHQIRCFGYLPKGPHLMTRARIVTLRKSPPHVASGCLRPAREPLRPPTRRRRLSASAPPPPSTSRASPASSSSSSARSTWARVSGSSPRASRAAPAGSAGSWGDRRCSPCSRTCRARTFPQCDLSVECQWTASRRVLVTLRKGARMGCTKAVRAAR